jgi:hypothetical protein
MPSQAIKDALNKYEAFLEVVEEKINANIALGKNTPSTALAKEVGKLFGWDWARGYQLINIYCDGRPELGSFNGKGGGIGLKDKEVKK